jgi:hypothetical protein
VEYALYITLVLCSLVFCGQKLKELRQQSQSEMAMRRVGQTDLAKANEGEVGHHDRFDNDKSGRGRELLKVPTPWGWPGNANGHHGIHHAFLHPQVTGGVSGSLHRWVDHLVAEKQTTEDQQYLKRREASMRALLEDRFFSPGHMAENKHHNARSHLLRNHSEPHDQMDNLPSDKVRKIESRLSDGNEPVAVGQVNIEPIVYEQLSDVKTPWGW